VERGRRDEEKEKGDCAIVLFRQSNAFFNLLLDPRPSTLDTRPSPFPPKAASDTAGEGGAISVPLTLQLNEL